MPRFVVTGASGVLGSGFRKMFSSADIVSFEGDITNYEKVREFLSKAGAYDALFHFAAIVPRKMVDANPVLAFNVNVMGTLNILEAVRMTTSPGARPWIFHASTSHVYAPSDSPLKESAALQPHSLYGLSKLQAEQICETYAKNHSLPICVGRIFSFSDPLQSEDFFMPATFRRVLNLPRGAKLEMPGLTSARDFLRVSQVCSAIGKLMEKRIDGTVNIGTGVGVPLLSMVEKIAKSLRREDVVITPMQDQPLELTANIDRLASFGVKLECEVDQLIDEMATHFLHQS